MLLIKTGRNCLPRVPGRPIPLLDVDVVDDDVVDEWARGGGLWIVGIGGNLDNEVEVVVDGAGIKVEGITVTGIDELDGNCLGEEEIIFSFCGKHFSSGGKEEEEEEESATFVSEDKPGLIRAEFHTPFLSNSRGNLSFIGIADSTVSFNTSLLLLLPVTTWFGIEGSGEESGEAGNAYCGIRLAC